MSANLAEFAFQTANRVENATFDTDSVSIILDSGASAGFTHCLQDFVSFSPLSSTVRGLGRLEIKGIGTVKYKIVTNKGILTTLSIDNVYYVPELQTRLLSPQQLCSQYNTVGEFGSNFMTIRWDNHVKTCYTRKASNLPVLDTAPGSEIAQTIYNAVHSSKQDETYCFRMQKTIPQFNLQGSSTQADDAETSTSSIPTSSDSTHEKSSQKKSSTTHINVKCSSTKCKDCKIFQNPSTTTREGANSETSNSAFNIDLNKINNMTTDQREFLHIHEKYDHINFNTLKDLAREGIIPKKFKNIEPPICLGCQLGKAHKIKRNKNNSIAGESITKPGQLVHMDQAESQNPGRPMTHSGNNNKNKIKVFTVFVDSVSKKIFVEFQTSTNAIQTLNGKHRFERMAHSHGVKIENYRADNGIFKSAVIKHDIEKNNQDITFCGVGAHHQNGVAERNIRTIVERARTLLLHSMTKWPNKATTELWTFALNYTVDKWNATPRKDLSFLSPNEVFSGLHLSTEERTELFRNFHVWGCPVLVLRDKLQDNNSLDKWDSRTRTGIFVGWSRHHSRSVALVLNPETDHISPQYHVVFDNKFQTVGKLNKTNNLEQWKLLSKTSSYYSSGDDIKIYFDTYSKPPQTQQLEEPTTVQGPQHHDSTRPSNQRESIPK